MKKKLIIGCVIAIILIILAIFIFVRFVPGDKIVNLVGSDSSVSDILCIYPVRVQGDSMNPIFSSGDQVNFNKCIEDKENIPLDTIVIYDNGNVIVMGRIRETIDGPSGIYYKISPEARVGDIRDVYPDKIIGFYKE